MARKLFTVEGTFLIQGRGLILVPGLPREGDIRIPIGDPISIRRPDGSIASMRIKSIELCGSYRPGIPIVVDASNKEEVPIGSEVWSIESPE